MAARNELFVTSTLLHVCFVDLHLVARSLRFEFCFWIFNRLDAVYWGWRNWDGAQDNYTERWAYFRVLDVHSLLNESERPFVGLSITFAQWWTYSFSFILHCCYYAPKLRCWLIATLHFTAWKRPTVWKFRLLNAFQFHSIRRAK